eukprot:4309223-Prymnesium_polylepis.1
MDAAGGTHARVKNDTAVDARPTRAFRATPCRELTCLIHVWVNLIKSAAHPTPVLTAERCASSAYGCERARESG